MVPSTVSEDVSVHMASQTELVASYTEQLQMMMAQNKTLLDNHAALQALNLIDSANNRSVKIVEL